MPGFGRADRPRTFDFSPRGYARYLGAVLEQLGAERAHLVVFGGAWGLSWALDHRDALLSITLINSVPPAAFRWHFFARVWQTPVLGELFQALTTDRSIRWVMNRDNPRPFPEAFMKRLLGFADLRQKLLASARAGDHRIGPIFRERVSSRTERCECGGAGAGLKAGGQWATLLVAYPGGSCIRRGHVY